MLRWLLPLLAVFALLGNAALGWAAAGAFGEASCCCPKPEKCKCHDHEGTPLTQDTLKRCAGEGTLAPPSVVLAAIELPAVLSCECIVTVLSATSLPAPRDAIPPPPEKPPS